MSELETALPTPDDERFEEDLRAVFEESVVGFSAVLRARARDFWEKSRELGPFFSDAEQAHADLVSVFGERVSEFSSGLLSKFKALRARACAYDRETSEFLRVAEGRRWELFQLAKIPNFMADGVLSSGVFVHDSLPLISPVTLSPEQAAELHDAFRMAREAIGPSIDLSSHRDRFVDRIGGVRMASRLGEGTALCRVCGANHGHRAPCTE